MELNSAGPYGIDSSRQHSCDKPTWKAWNEGQRLQTASTIASSLPVIYGNRAAWPPTPGRVRDRRKSDGVGGWQNGGDVEMTMNSTGLYGTNLSDVCTINQSAEFRSAAANSFCYTVVVHRHLWRPDNFSSKTKILGDDRWWQPIDVIVLPQRDKLKIINKGLINKSNNLW